MASDVAENACKAAFTDKRFGALKKDEFRQHQITLSISVLSPAVEMNFTDENNLVSQLRPHKDGVILEDKDARGVFLPVVWEGLPDPQKFLTQLKLKAGFAEDYWSPTIKAWRYVTESVSSKDLPPHINLWNPN